MLFLHCSSFNHSSTLLHKYSNSSADILHPPLALSPLVLPFTLQLHLPLVTTASSFTSCSLMHFHFKSSHLFHHFNFDNLLLNSSDTQPFSPSYFNLLLLLKNYLFLHPATVSGARSSEDPSLHASSSSLCCFITSSYDTIQPHSASLSPHLFNADMSLHSSLTFGAPSSSLMHHCFLLPIWSMHLPCF